ncbi:MAG: hypothetical protein ABL986_05775 [Vicinamibacterales bacterium]
MSRSSHHPLTFRLNIRVNIHDADFKCIIDGRLYCKEVATIARLADYFYKSLEKKVLSLRSHPGMRRDGGSWGGPLQGGALAGA